jgi:capsular exopolysaccharide synthesis family protein
MNDQFESFDEPAAPEPAKAEAHFSDYLDIVLKRRKLIIVCMVAAMLGGVLLTILTKPMYKAIAVLDVTKRNSNPLGFGNTQDSGADPEFLPSQIQLMQSREVSERVARKLNLLADADLNPKHFRRYRPDAKGNVRKPSDEDIIDAAIDLQGSVDAQIVRPTTLVQLSVAAPNPKLSADLANAVADAYIEWNVESRYRTMGQSSQFLTAQIAQAKAEVEAKEKELLAYSGKKELVSADASNNPAAQKLENVQKDLAAATTDRVAKEAHYEEVRNTPADTLADVASGGSLSMQRGELQKMQRDYADKLSIYKPEWPAMQQLKGQIDQTQKNIETFRSEAASHQIDTARADYLTALRREQNLQSMARTQRGQALAEGGDAIEYRNLKVEVDTKRALLDELLKQQSETEVVSRLRDQEQITSVRVVDRALPPPEPYKPSLKKNLLMTFVLGAGIGVGLAFLLSNLDRSLRTPEQVERLLQLPALGVIPAVGPVDAAEGSRLRGWFRRRGAAAGSDEKTSIELLPHTEPRSPVAEAYRAFRAATLLSRAGGVRTITVTSGFPDEGKTATAVNLAIVLAQLGRRVLVVDADLHKSRIHEIFQVSNRTGLVSVLAENLEPSRAIVKTNFPGVFVLPAGPETPNPSGLLSSDAMRKFMELAATNFDYVIVDSPPVLLVSDTLVFAQQTDGVLLCVRGGVTPREEAVRARDRILRTGASILGVLINALVPEPGGYYYRSYSYSYGNEKREAEVTTEPRAAQGS